MSVDLGFLADWWWKPLMDQVIIPLTEPIADAIAEGVGEVVEEMEEFSECTGDDQAEMSKDGDEQNACDSVGENDQGS